MSIKKIVLYSVLLIIAAVAINGGIGEDTTDNIQQSASDTGEINEDYRGTQGVENTYTAWDMDFDEAEDYGCGIVYSVDLKPGDTIEVTAETNIPANFISGDEQFDMCYRVSDGNFGSSSISGMDHGSIYQSESYSNAKYYQLTKEIDREFFSLAIQNPAGDSSLTGHIKIVVHSKFTEAEHGTTSSYYTDANGVATRSQELADEAKALSDEWQEDRWADAVDY